MLSPKSVANMPIHRIIWKACLSISSEMLPTTPSRSPLANWTTARLKRISIGGNALVASLRRRAAQFVSFTSMFFHAAEEALGFYGRGCSVVTDRQSFERGSRNSLFQFASPSLADSFVNVGVDVSCMYLRRLRVDAWPDWPSTIHSSGMSSISLFGPTKLATSQPKHAKRAQYNAVDLITTGTNGTNDAKPISDPLNPANSPNNPTLRVHRQPSASSPETAKNIDWSALWVISVADLVASGALGVDGRRLCWRGLHGSGREDGVEEEVH
ncbi:hypothetical protein FA95DRAFT_419318 [Auriscalpium vulgare]|uniref:Uncharacterized protein n=1 Tax=Auriscalpium vulgare TaxID=40419 RepID=A0ACB8S522_9AGAM|nr:hypothetical protein FA95DRAFT_419318 [Auriscalpium vulgare]